jgi:hypothetical protein
MKLFPFGTRSKDNDSTRKSKRPLPREFPPAAGPSIREKTVETPAAESGTLL